MFDQGVDGLGRPSARIADPEGHPEGHPEGAYGG